jgi:PAS domain S-box-containing protein
MKKRYTSEKSTLRRKAEEQLSKRQSDADFNISDNDTVKLIYELQVHQIELELQNEELLLAIQSAESSAKKFIELYDYAPSGYFTLSEDGKILALNLKGASILGKDRFRLLDTMFLYYVSDNSKPVFRNFLKKVFKDKRYESCEVVISIADRILPLYVLITGQITENVLQCIVTMVDITGRKQFEEEMIKSEFLLSSIIECQKDTIIFTIDTNYRYLYFNRAHRETMKFAYNCDVKIGMNILSCITSDDDRAAAKTNYDMALAGESHTNIRKFGEINPAWYESFFNPIKDKNNAIIGITGLARNITERTDIEKELESQSNAFKKLNQFALELSNLSSDDNLEAFIVKQAKEITGAKVTIFSEYNPEVRTTSTRQIEIEPGLIEKVITLLGKQIKDIHSVVSDDDYRIITSEIVVITKTLHEASFGTIPHSVGSTLQALLKVDRIIRLAYLTDGKLYGTSLLFMGKDQPVQPKEILENFSHMAALTLRCRYAEQNHRESEERFRAIYLQ